MSRLTARIMAIMLFPLAIFLVGLLSLDQYRTTLIQSEFVALERQGFTLARSLALAEAERDRRVARRQLSPETMTHLIPLVGLGSSLRARVFQPNGSLLADTARRSGFQPNVDIRRHLDKSWRQKIRNNLNDMVTAASGWVSPFDELPAYVERRRQRARPYAEGIAALSGAPRRALRGERDGSVSGAVAVGVRRVRLRAPRGGAGCVRFQRRRAAAAALPLCDGGVGMARAPSLAARAGSPWADRPTSPRR